ncbi:hypothetical protein NJL88_35225 [Streptomyces sp. DK15]|uniref:hypothetical protein n=1 Tax=Streptomyces sp. DK15 TaxID=2957499 RepID=UPI0029BB1D3B|nr:hypothetical protein [Streptomyces sp. DK15]MDX2395216.1 hypothetical protein [Streptomyces sp. DK15]
MARLNFTACLGQEACKLSGGTQQKLNLTLALMHDPDVVVTGSTAFCYRYMTLIRTISALALAVTGAPLASTPASATTIVGFGNGAVNNSCSNSGTVGRSNGATTQAQGIATALTVALPASGPANQCGNLGLQTVDGQSSKVLYKVSGGVDDWFAE